MNLIYENSLAKTADAVNEALFFGKVIEKRQKKEIAVWIASRQGLKGSYRGMFAPTPADFETGIKMFTGEPISTGAGTSHILSEESSRILFKLNVRNKTVSNALETANRELDMVIREAVKTGYFEGTYCCAKCTVAYWLNLTAGGLSRQEKRLNLGMKFLNSRRDGKGRWRSMPYYYTLLALSEINSPLAKKELEYTAPGLEKLLNRFDIKNKYGKRRRALVERVLDMV